MKVLCSQEVVRPHRCSCPMSGHCKGVCIPDTMVCALVRGFPREVRRGWQSQKPLIFMHFHEVFLGSQHEIWSKQHNGKVRNMPSRKKNSKHMLCHRNILDLLSMTCIWVLSKHRSATEGK